jgi:hypothetical protein
MIIMIMIIIIIIIFMVKQFSTLASGDVTECSPIRYSIPIGDSIGNSSFDSVDFLSDRKVQKSSVPPSRPGALNQVREEAAGAGGEAAEA